MSIRRPSNNADSLPQHLLSQPIDSNGELPSGHQLHRPPPPLRGNDGSKHFHAERLVKYRKVGDAVQYLVKWLGYPAADNTWEPESRLVEDCADIVGAYMRSHGAGRR